MTLNMTCDILPLDLLESEARRLVTRSENGITSDLLTLSSDIESGLRDIDLQDYVFGKQPPRECRLVSLMNNAAQLYGHYGELEQAAALNHHAIDVCADLLHITRNTQWLAPMIQHYINLGRIYGTLGQLQSSLEIVSSIYRFFHEAQGFTIDNVAFSPSDIPAILEAEPSLDRVATNVYLKDSLGAYFATEKYVDALTFLAYVEREPPITEPALRQSLLEGRARALMLSGRFKEALVVLAQVKELFDRTRSPNVAVYTLLAEVYRRSGWLDRSLRVTQILERYLVDMERAGLSPAVLLQTTYQLSLSQFLIRDYERAYENGRAALDLATDTNNEICVTRSLVLLLHISLLRPELSYRRMGPLFWFEQLRWACEGTYYRTERMLATRTLACTAETVGVDKAESLRVQFLKDLENMQVSVGSVSFETSDDCNAGASCLTERSKQRLDGEHTHHHPTITRLYERMMAVDVGTVNRERKAGATVR